MVCKVYEKMGVIVVIGLGNNKLIYGLWLSYLFGLIKIRN